jgi:hypothetical protein
MERSGTVTTIPKLRKSRRRRLMSLGIVVTVPDLSSGSVGF